MATPRKSITRKSGTAAQTRAGRREGLRPRAREERAREEVGDRGAPVRSALPARGKEPGARQEDAANATAAGHQERRRRPTQGRQAGSARGRDEERHEDESGSGSETARVLPPAAIARGSARPAPRLRLVHDRPIHLPWPRPPPVLERNA